MTDTHVMIDIIYDGKLDLNETTDLFNRIKGQLGGRPVSGFHYDTVYVDTDDTTTEIS